MPAEMPGAAPESSTADDVAAAVAAATGTGLACAKAMIPNGFNVSRLDSSSNGLKKRGLTRGDPRRPASCASTATALALNSSAIANMASVLQRVIA